MRKNIVSNRVQGETPVIKRTSFPSTVVGDQVEVVTSSCKRSPPGGNLWTSGSRRRRRHLRKTVDQRNGSHLREIILLASPFQHRSQALRGPSLALWTGILIYIYSASLIVTFACFNCLLISILYVTIRLMNTIHAIYNSVWTFTEFDNVLLKSIWVWLSGLRLYLQSDRDKTLQTYKMCLCSCSF